MQIYFFVIKPFIMQEFANQIHMRGFETALNKQIPKIRVYEFCNIKIDSRCFRPIVAQTRVGFVTLVGNVGRKMGGNSY